MSIITKYIITDLLKKILFLTVGFMLLFAFFSFIADIENVTNKNVNFESIIFSQILNLPNIIYDVIPLATLIGSLWSFSSFATGSEFVVILASGFSFKNFLRMIFICGLPLAIFTFFLSEFFVPATDFIKEKIKIKESGYEKAHNSGLWIRDFIKNDQKNSTLNERIIKVGNIKINGELSLIQIYEFDKNNKLIRKIESDFGLFIKSKSNENLEPVNRWEIYSPVILEVKENGVIRKKKVKILALETNISKDTLFALTIKPEKMSATELAKYISYLEQSNQETSSYKIVFWKKVIYPFLIWIMILIATPSAFIQNRKGGIGLKIFAGVVFGIIFHLFNGLVSHIGILNTWPAFFVAVLPPISALFIGLFFLLKTQRPALLHYRNV